MQTTTTQLKIYDEHLNLCFQGKLPGETKKRVMIEQLLEKSRCFLSYDDTQYYRVVDYVEKVN